MSNEEDLHKTNKLLTEAETLLMRVEATNTEHRIRAYDSLIQIHRISAQIQRCEYIKKIFLAKLIAMGASREIIDNVVKYPQAWGLSGKMLPDGVLGVDSPIEPEEEDKDIPHVQVGKAGGSRAAGVPAVVDQDSAEIRARSTRTAPPGPENYPIPPKHNPIG